MTEVASEGGEKRIPDRDAAEIGVTGPDAPEARSAGTKPAEKGTDSSDLAHSGGGGAMLSQVYLAGVEDRAAVTQLLLRKAGLHGVAGKSVILKANFNSADPFPASTHLDTLRVLVTLLWQAGAREITLVERSGMGDTRANLTKLGVFALAKNLAFRVVVLDEQPRKQWVHIPRGGTHWLRGFYLPRVVLQADMVVQTCCLKTHRFGGQFTMSLKNSVGLVAKRLPGTIYDYMYELHASPFQRLMIAEINAHYSVDLVLLDAARAFISGGPDKGEEAAPGLMLASRDRVAVDAVGVALLREFGARELTKKPVFEWEQIQRAAELGVGAASPAAMELVALDERGRAARERVKAQFGDVAS